jgi:hypothetical protein
MKKYFTLGVFSLLFITITHAQVGAPGNNPNKDAVLDLNNTNGINTKGLLLPKVALNAANTSTLPLGKIAGTKVYNTAKSSTGSTAVFPGIYTNDGTNWIKSETNSKIWFLNGNAGTNPATDFIGTTDATDVVIKTNSTEKMRIAGTGQVLIGTSTVPATSANVKLIVDNGNKGGAIQLKDGTEADGAVLMTYPYDTNGIASWVTRGNNDTGTGIYRSTVAQTFTSGTATTLQTNKTIKITEPGNYMVSVRWWGTTGAPNANLQVEADIILNKNGTQFDFLQQYETVLGTAATITFTSNLIVTNCTENDVLTIAIKPNYGGNWATGSYGLGTNIMPSLMVVKL